MPCLWLQRHAYARKFFARLYYDRWLKRKHMTLSPLKRKQILMGLAGCYFIEVFFALLAYWQMPKNMSSFLLISCLLVANAAVLIWIAYKFGVNYRPSIEGLLPFILNDLNDGIFDYNLKTNKISYSQSYMAMFGYAGEDMSGDQDDFYNYVHPDDLPTAVAHMQQYLRQEIPAYHNTFRVRHKNGSWIWVMSRGVGLRDDHGNFYRLIGTHTDVTAQKQREEDLKRLVQENEMQRTELIAEKIRAESANHAKTEFLATMSHEIRTPMNAVTGLAEIMLKTNLDARQKEMMETLHANTGILLRLVNNILDLERIELGQVDFEMRSLNFEKIFAHLRTMFAAQASAKNLDFKLINSIGNRSFIGDTARLDQILINLIGNALKFTLEGEIVISAHISSEENDKALVRVVVTDTGVGIPDDKCLAIFERFTQADQTISRRFGGSGLGLAISRSLARLMKGDITVESQLGKGSSFMVTLPLEIEQAQPLPLSFEKQAHQSKADSSGTVLLVEDYAANVMVATMMLEDLNYNVELAKNGLEAIAKIDNRPMPYAAVLMDVQMHEMDGYETTRRVRALEKTKGFQNYIIGVTANALVGDRDKCIAAGMDDYMSKPINIEMLRQKIARSRAQAA